MAKLSALDKIVKELEAEIAEHRRAIEDLARMIARLKAQQTLVRKPRPRVVKPASEKTA